MAGKKTQLMWTLEDAEEFLKQLKPVLDYAGYEAEIRGSVAKKGYSNHDLDIQLEPVNEDVSDEPLFEFFRSAGWRFDYLRYSQTQNVLNVLLPDGRVVDFFGGEYGRYTES